MSAERLRFAPVAEVLPAADNARLHTDEQVEQIADSLRAFGFINPIIVAPDGSILAGHGRLAAAQRLYAEGAVIDGVPNGMVPVRMVERLSPEEQRAYRVADNRLGSLSTFDAETLSSELQSLKDEGFDPALLGFSELDMARLDDDVTRLRFMEDETPEENAPETRPPRTPNGGEGFVQMELLIPAADRQIVYDAIAMARERWNLASSGAALSALLTQVDSTS